MSDLYCQTDEQMARPEPHYTVGRTTGTVALPLRAAVAARTNRRRAAKLAGAVCGPEYCA
jgi:hypothetical protein